MLEKWFTSPAHVAAHALKSWRLVYRRTCLCADGSGFREEIGKTGGTSLECQCGGRVVRIDNGERAR